MAVQRVVLGRTDLPVAVATLRAWESAGGYPGGLHAGDVGWHARLPDDQLDGTLEAYVRNGEWVAFALVEPGLVRPRLSPTQVFDAEVAQAVAEAVDAVEGDEVFSDADPGTPFRAALAARGWGTEPESWVCLYRPLTAADARFDDPLTAPTSTSGVPDDAAVAERVAVQRSAFAGSTFTVEAWRRMAAAPAFDPSLDLLRRTPSGEPAAACTAWSSRPGACAILEPVGTHSDHQGRGHGKAVVLAAVAALAKAGASGVCVHTPTDNAAAVAAYVSCGLRPVSYDHAMVRRR